MQARDLPHLLDVSGHRLPAVIDLERVHGVRGSLSGYRVPEPVGFRQVRALDPEDPQPPVENFVRCKYEVVLRRLRDALGGFRGKERSNRGTRAGRHRSEWRSWPDLAACP